MRNNTFLKFKNRKNNLPTHTEQAGVSLIIAFFVMTIILAVVLSITTLLYQEIKMIRNIGNSVVAFYAADSGVEKVLYYDRKVIPEGAKRGLCSMFAYSAENLLACPKSNNVSGLDSGVYCNQYVDANTNVTAEFLQPTDTTNYPNGCDADKCNACKISFTTTYSPDAVANNDRTYNTVATVSPIENEEYSTLTIDSTGLFRSLSRKVELYMSKAEVGEFIIISNASATPISSEEGEAISIVTSVKADNGVSLAQAHIKSSSTGSDIAGSPIDLTLDYTLKADGTLNNGVFSGIWTGTTAGAYYVDIEVLDAKGYSTKKLNIQPF